MANVDSIKFKEQLENESQIPFLDFSFFPVAEDMYDLAGVDYGFGNFDNSAEVKVDTLNFKSGDSLQIDSTNSFPLKQGEDSSVESKRSPAIGAHIASSSVQSKYSSLQMEFSFSGTTNNKNKSKPIQEKRWNERYNEFLRFIKENGHGAVPYTYPSNKQLARWVKRQRRQYKLKQEGKSSTMTIERVDLLSSVGFIWDPHEANWKEKLAALKQFRFEHGHCNVPKKYKDQNLGTWVKCQRRNYKLCCEGKLSSMNHNRIEDLEKLGFEWERNIARKI